MKLLLGKIKVKASTLLMILYLSVVMSANTVLSYIRVPRIWLCGVIGIVHYLFNRDSYLFRNSIGKIYAAWLLFLAVNTVFSYNVSASFSSFIIFISLYAFMAFDFDINELLVMAKCIRIITLFMAFTIFLNVLIPNLFSGPLNFMVAQTSVAVQNAVASGSYSGIAGEKAEAAFYMVIGITFYIGELIYRNVGYTLKTLSPILIYIMALLFTGKRMLLLLAVVVVAFSFIFLGVKNKNALVSLLIAIGIIVPSLILTVQLVPQAQVSFRRFAEYSGDTTYSGRTVFWNFCVYMFMKHPVIGFGFDTFNTAFGDLTSFSFKGQKWNMYAHSLYYELLGETGILGMVLFFSMIVYSFINSWSKLIKCKNAIGCDEAFVNVLRMFLFISMSIQMVFCLYGITGNVIYNPGQYGFLILSFVFALVADKYSNYLEGKIDYQ